MFVFNFSNWLVRGVFGFSRIFCLVTVMVFPIFVMFKAFVTGNPNAVYYIIPALTLPGLTYFLYLFVLKKLDKTSENNSVAYSDAADDLLYGSNQPMYSPQSLVNSELPYTDEHLAKYGSTD